MKIADLKHPTYRVMAPRWEEFRLIYEGGKAFQEEFLLQRLKELPNDFNLRKKISPIPTHAKAAVNNVKNSLYSRIGQSTTRIDGPRSYQIASKGENGGVDREHSSMNSFLNRKILPELLPIGKVGVFIDAPLVRTSENSPYLRTIRAEDIFNWEIDPVNRGEFLQLLIRERLTNKDDTFGLPTETEATYRLFQKTPEGILISFFDKDSELIEQDTLDLERIPFVLFELTESLLTDVGSYQIALLNLSSSDMTYAYLSNIPIYTEQVDDNDLWGTIEDQTSDEKISPPTDAVLAAHVGVKKTVDEAGRQDVIGVSRGRAYPKGLDRPGFISPSPAPLEVSMKKAQEIKDDIRLIINLSLSNIKPRAASAESKVADERGLESGLSAIGLELEAGENAILNIWAIYEEVKNNGKVTYPNNYELKDDTERRKSADDILTLKEKLPSRTARIELTKDAAREIFGSRLPQEKMEQLLTELDNAGGCPSGAKEIKLDLEEGLVSAATASELRGYKKDEAAKAQKEKAKRMADAQASQRGEEDFEENKRELGKQNQDDTQVTTVVD